MTVGVNRLLKERNISTIKPLAWHEIMEGYARHKIAEAQAESNNSGMLKCLCDWRILNGGTYQRSHVDGCPVHEGRMRS